MKAVRFISAAAIAACIAFTACSDYVGKEATHPLYAKAMSAKNAKSYRESAESFEEFLTICPKSPKAHYDVALVYKENLQNYPAAIYHLMKYLELSGETLSQQDQDAIRRYIQDCERQMFESYRTRNDIKLADDVPQLDPAKLAAKNAENAALRKKLQEYIENQDVILAQNKELRNRLARANEAAAAAAASAKPPQAAASGTQTASSATSAATPAENGVRYYVVEKGDGLQAISLKMYGTVAKWKIIQEANKDTVGKNGEVKIGQKLVIPPANQQ